jgi:hypothetical protein
MCLDTLIKKFGKRMKEAKGLLRKFLSGSLLAPLTFREDMCPHFA